jgi:hypothetical protein
MSATTASIVRTDCPNGVQCRIAGPMATRRLQHNTRPMPIGHCPCVATRHDCSSSSRKPIGHYMQSVGTVFKQKGGLTWCLVPASLSSDARTGTPALQHASMPGQKRPACLCGVLANLHLCLCLRSQLIRIMAQGLLHATHNESIDRGRYG